MWRMNAAISFVFFAISTLMHIRHTAPLGDRTRHQLNHPGSPVLPWRWKSRQNHLRKPIILLLVGRFTVHRYVPPVSQEEQSRDAEKTADEDAPQQVAPSIEQLDPEIPRYRGPRATFSSAWHSTALSL
jgi:hypothetical protein